MLICKETGELHVVPVVDIHTHGARLLGDGVDPQRWEIQRVAWLQRDAKRAPFLGGHGLYGVDDPRDLGLVDGVDVQGACGVEAVLLLRNVAGGEAPGV